MLLAVGGGAALVTLALAFAVFRFLTSAQEPSVVSTPVAAPAQLQPTTAPALLQLPTPAPTPQVAGIQATAAPSQASPPVAASACSAATNEAQSLAQSKRWADAATKLESVRGQCDVVGPLYDVYLNQARALADDERAADAVTMFDKALAVKNGTEASNEKALAVAYQAGRTALDAGDFDAAISNLTRVQSTKADYARGNNALNLINAYLAKGDQLVAAGNCAEALSNFQRADALKPNESVITQRISNASQCGRPTLAPAPAFNPPPPAAAPAASLPPVEPTVRGYYDALNAHRYGEAYGVLSSAAQSSQTLSSFSGRFTNTRAISLRYVDGVSFQDSTAQLSAHTQTVTFDGARNVTSCSRVVWVLILQGGQWHRDIRSESSNEFGERC
jgi:tetratricopeptide (TPR) repeat protein